jgi:outer membrane protein assembly factor BamA
LELVLKQFPQLKKIIFIKILSYFLLMQWFSPSLHSQSIFSGEIINFVKNYKKPLFENYELSINWLQETPSNFENKLNIDLEPRDSLSAINELRKTLLKLQNETYLEASIDSLTLQDSIFTVHFYLGKTYEWASMTNGNVENTFLEQVGFREKLYQKKPFNYRDVVKMQERLLEYAENNGYPFASVWLDNILVKNGKISATLFMNKGRLVIFETVNVVGDAKISKAYLKNYLGLKSGSLYSKAKILKVKSRLQELPFLKESRNATINFEDKNATVNLFVKKKKASRFDFLIGILPGGQGNNPQQGQRDKLLLTGTFDAEMHNQFGLGEKIFVSFERLRPETQQLELSFAYPYILDLPFGLDLNFSQYKRDTTYTDVAFDVGLQYLFEGGNYVKAFWNNASSNLISVDTIAIKNGIAPNNLDVSNRSYGLEFSLQKLNYRYNPRKGWSVFFRGGAGFKNIPENNKILEVDESFYDSLQLKTFQFRVRGGLEKYFPVLNNVAIKTAIRGGIIFSEAAIYQNEQFRLGGNKLLRGFDEESIFATSYAILTVETRLLVGQNSYFYAFGDFAYLEDKTTTADASDCPYGMGLGLTFETGVGLFGLSLAVGSQQQNPINFGNPKIHFGYVNYF